MGTEIGNKICFRDEIPTRYGRTRESWRIWNQYVSDEVNTYITQKIKAHGNKWKGRLEKMDERLPEKAPKYKAK